MGIGGERRPGDGKMGRKGWEMGQKAGNKGRRPVCLPGEVMGREIGQGEQRARKGAGN